MNIKGQVLNIQELLGFIVVELKGLQEFIEIKKINNQFYRRIFLKGYFSILESFLFLTREMVKLKIQFDNNTNEFTWSDFAALNGQKVNVNERGEVTISSNFQRFKPSLIFTLTIFAKAFNTELPDYKDSTFKKLDALYTRRNEVTHPKSYIQFMISDQEVKDIFSMHSWFGQTHSSITQKFTEWIAVINESGRLDN